MPFDWMEPACPPHLAAKGATARKKMHEDEVRQRAALLRRLGRDRAHAVHRCLGNLDWAFEMRGTPPVAREEVRALVARVYA